MVIKDTATTFYRSFKRLTKEPRLISPSFGAYCSLASKQAADARDASYGPHMARALHTYANPVAVDAITAIPAEFPIGAVIVKEKLKLGKRGRYYFSEVGGMIKRAKGYDPANGDWEFFFYTPGGEFNTGKLANCIDCHSGGKRDHVFSLWSLSQPLVDPHRQKSAREAYTAPPLPNTSRQSASQVRGETEAKLEIKNKVLFSEDTKQAIAAFDAMMKGKQADWDELIVLMHYYPKRYALLMTGLNEGQREKFDFQNPDPFGFYTLYLHKRTEESEDFARKSAIGWRDGWNSTCADMLPKLLTKGFPSTRRIAIEFLKMENKEETFGYDWKAEPDAGDPAIQKWQAWINQHFKQEDKVEKQ